MQAPMWQLWYCVLPFFRKQSDIYYFLVDGIGACCILLIILTMIMKTIVLYNTCSLSLLTFESHNICIILLYYINIVFMSTTLCLNKFLLSKSKLYLEFCFQDRSRGAPAGPRCLYAKFCLHWIILCSAVPGETAAGLPSVSEWT